MRGVFGVCEGCVRLSSLSLSKERFVQNHPTLTKITFKFNDHPVLYL